MFKLKAFSLSEVLIVVALIGIVASLTLPNVSDDVDENKVISALRKIYPELATAYDDIVAEHGKPVDWNMPNNASGIDMTTKMAEYLKEKLPVKKDCGFNSGCFPSNDQNNIDTYSGMYKMVLKDGSALAIEFLSKSAMLTKIANHESLHPQDNEQYCDGAMGRIKVDVNGSTGDNLHGYDVFEFQMCYGNGFVADGDNPEGPMSDPTWSTAWALKAGNRDYLKCPNDLNWKTKRSCK